MWDRLREALGEDRLGIRTGVRRFPREHFVEDAPETVEVAATVDVAIPGRLLGAHVHRRTNREAGLGQSVPAGCDDRSSDAEIGNHRMPGLEEDILGLDVAVQYSVTVGILQRVRNFTSDLHSLAEWQGPFSEEPTAQRLDFCEGHDVVQQTADGARIVEG
jgi:hypothetical protein